jgi:hypothetical protein
MSVLHQFECAAHGVFETRVQAGIIPPCPKGCSKAFVQLVYLTPPSIGTERVKLASNLIKRAAELQHLSDIDVSPSSPGGSVADKNFLKSGNPIRAQAGPTFKVGSAQGQIDINSLPRGANGLNEAGFGHRYNQAEWRTGKDGKRRHYAQPPIEARPPLIYAGKPRGDR